MTYRGYGIIKAKHPTPVNPDSMGYDIMEGEKVRKANIANIETAKKVIDLMIQYRYWRELS